MAHLQKMDNNHSSAPKTREEIKELILGSSQYLTYADNITINEDKELTYFKRKHFQDHETKKETIITYTRVAVGTSPWIIIKQENYYGPGRHTIFAGTIIDLINRQELIRLHKKGIMQNLEPIIDKIIYNKPTTYIP